METPRQKPHRRLGEGASRLANALWRGTKALFRFIWRHILAFSLLVLLGLFALYVWGDLPSVLELAAVVLPTLMAIGIEIMDAQRRESKRGKGSIIAIGILVTAVTLAQQKNSRNEAELFRKQSELALENRQHSSDAKIDELKSQLHTLALPTVPAATDDMRIMHLEMTKGFDRLAAAIGSLGAKIPPKIEVQVPPPPIVVPNVTISQRRVASTDPQAPFVLQTVIQTDSPIETASFALECSGEIEGADFFVTGQGALLNVRTEISADRKVYAFRFGFPPFKPDTPIVVTISSKSEVRVVALRKWR